jgi:hypothetical protein
MGLKQPMVDPDMQPNDKNTPAANSEGTKPNALLIWCADNVCEKLSK